MDIQLNAAIAVFGYSFVTMPRAIEVNDQVIDTFIQNVVTAHFSSAEHVTEKERSDMLHAFKCSIVLGMHVARKVASVPEVSERIAIMDAVKRYFKDDNVSVIEEKLVEVFHGFVHDLYKEECISPYLASTEEVFDFITRMAFMYERECQTTKYDRLVALRTYKRMREVDETAAGPLVTMNKVKTALSNIKR